MRKTAFADRLAARQEKDRNRMPPKKPLAHIWERLPNNRAQCTICGTTGEYHGCGEVGISPDRESETICKGKKAGTKINKEEYRMAKEQNPSLKALQQLGKEMQEKIKFAPPIEFKSGDYEELKEDIVKNATAPKGEGLVEGDRDSLSEEAQRTLEKLGAAPWESDEQAEQDEEDPEEDGEDEEDPDEAAADQELEKDLADEDEDPEPATESKDPAKKSAGKKAPVGKRPGGVGSGAQLKDNNKSKAKEEKKTVKKESKPKATKEKKGKEEKKPGVISTIVELLKSGPITKENIVKRLAKQFPDRDAESMAKTVNVQVPGRVQKDRNLKLVEVEGKGWKVK